MIGPALALFGDASGAASATPTAIAASASGAAHTLNRFPIKLSSPGDPVDTEARMVARLRANANSVGCYARRSMGHPAGDDVALSGAASGDLRAPRRIGRGEAGIAVVVAVILAAAALRPALQDLLDRPAVAHWATIFVAIAIQAMPFLVLGVTISAAIAAFVPSGALPRVLPKNPAVAVPVAAVAGAALPGCECGSVPIAGRLVARGAPHAAALAFLLSAPAINPVVLVATAVAFPGKPEVVGARFLASLLAASAV